MEGTEELEPQQMFEDLTEKLLRSSGQCSTDIRDFGPLTDPQDTTDVPNRSNSINRSAQQGQSLDKQIFDSSSAAEPLQTSYTAVHSQTADHTSFIEERDRESDSDVKTELLNEDCTSLILTGQSSANHSKGEVVDPLLILPNKFDTISETSNNDYSKSLGLDLPTATAENLTEHSDDMETPATAECKYRWSKTVDTKNDEVGFYSSVAPNDPVLLTLDETAQAFFSEPIKIICGDYSGNLVIDGKTFPVEEFSVRSYTFEVDLFVREDDVNTQESNLFNKVKHSPVSQIADQEIKISSRSEELIKHHLVDQENKGNQDCRSVSQTPPVAMKRDSPIGNESKEGNFELSTSGLWGSGDLHVKYQTVSKQSDMLERSPSRGYDGFKSDVVEDVISVSSQRSYSPGNGSLDRENSLRGLSRPPLSNNFVHSSDGEALRRSRPSSVGDTNFDGAEKGSSRSSLVGIFPSPASSSLVGSPKQTPTHDSLDGYPMSSNRFSLSSNQRSIEKAEQSSGRSFPVSRRSPSPLQNQMAVNIDNILPPVWNTTVSGHSTPQKSMASSQLNSERVRLGENGAMLSNYSSKPPSHPNTRPPSRNSSTVSMTSEQELAQYMEAKSRHSSGEKAIGKSQPLYSNEFLETSGVKGSEKAVSLPNYQQHLNGRSSTPDNQVRVPPSDLLSFRNALVTERMEDILGKSNQSISVTSLSRNSSCSVTPVASDSTVKDLSNVDQIYDLEASVSNLRKLLTNRESEVHTLQAQLADLKDINRSLREEMEHRVHRYTPLSQVQESTEFKQLQSEKEILASEVVSLREQLQRINRIQNPSGHNSVNSAIVDYNPTSPVVLQRKIADLEAHIRDMQEVTESTLANLTRAEDKVKQLQEENIELKTKLKNSSEFQVGQGFMYTDN